MSTPAAPGWFLDALGVQSTSHNVEISGARIHYLRWGDTAKPALLFIHGSGAHAHWWDFIAPFFLSHYQAIAVDLSGMGDSAYRPRYSPDIFAEEIAGVITHARVEKPVLIGHSFGGYVALKTGTLFANMVSGMVLVDSPVRPPDYAWEHNPRFSPIRPKKNYPDRETALGRFRLIPAQPCDNPFILHHIAVHSLKQSVDGWSWKFDENLFRDFSFGNFSGDLSNLQCRIGVVYGEKSGLFTQEVADYMFGVLDKNVPFVAIPEANHHLFLDQPLAFVAALRAVLAEWRHSRPLRAVPAMFPSAD